MADEYGDTGRGYGMGGRGRLSLRNLRTFTSFKNPVYRLYYSSTLFEMGGMHMQMFARTWLVYRLTESPAIMGAMSFAHAVPMLTLSLFGGALADRLQKKYVLLAGQVCSVIISIGIALSLAFGYLSAERSGSLWILVAASIFQGATMAIVMPSRQSILPEIVGQEHLMNAISLNTMLMNILQLFTPAVTGFLIAALDYQGVYYFCTGMYVMAFVLITFLPRTGTTSASSRGTMENIKEGLKYVRSQTHILLILAISLVIVLLSQPYIMMLPVFCVEILHVAEEQGGVLSSVSGAGAMVGSLILASLPNRKRGIMLLISGILMGVFLAGFAFSTSWNVSLTLIIFVGIMQTARMALGNTLLQYYIDPEYRGRVMSLYMMQFGLISLGTFSAGLLAESIGVQWAIGGFAISLACIFSLALIFLRQIRNLE